MTLTVGSLFSGIGGMELGLERAGMQVKWQVENDNYCRRVLAKHWPDVPKFGDIRELIGDELESVDLICGGFPCQPVSFAGRGKAQHDERWLWPEFERIVRVLRPRYVLVENVPGLVNRGLSDVLRSLAALRYDAEWDIVPAEAVGAPHLRERVCLVAYPYRTGLERGVFRPEAGLFPPDFISPHPLWTCSWPPDNLPKPVIVRGDDGFSSRMDRLKAIGNAVVPQVAEYIGHLILEFHHESMAQNAIEG